MDLTQLVNDIQHLEPAYIYKTKNEVQKKLNKSFYMTLTYIVYKT